MCVWYRPDHGKALDFNTQMASGAFEALHNLFDHVRVRVIKGWPKKGPNFFFYKKDEKTLNMSGLGQSKVGLKRFQSFVF